MTATDQHLSDEELHFLGIKVVYKHMVDDGYNVLQVRKETDIDPQILAVKDGQRYLVVVRTGRYPDMGVLKPETAARVLLHAKKNKAECLFAGVGIANADGETDEDMRYPVKGGEYYINFKGLVPFTK